MSCPSINRQWDTETEFSCHCSSFADDSCLLCPASSPVLFLKWHYHTNLSLHWWSLFFLSSAWPVVWLVAPTSPDTSCPWREDRSESRKTSEVHSSVPSHPPDLLQEGGRRQRPHLCWTHSNLPAFLCSSQGNAIVTLSSNWLPLGKAMPAGARGSCITWVF